MENKNLPETLQIILHGVDYESLSDENKIHYIDMALRSLTADYYYGQFNKRKLVLQDIEFLKKLQRELMKNNS